MEMSDVSLNIIIYFDSITAPTSFFLVGSIASLPHVGGPEGTGHSTRDSAPCNVLSGPCQGHFLEDPRREQSESTCRYINIYIVRLYIYIYI